MTTRAEEIAAKEYPDDAFRKADRATKDFPAGPYPGHETELRRAAFIKGYKRGQQDRWILVSDESKLPPIHEEPFTEDGFVLILLQCADWPSKYKTMKASRTIGDWDDDGAPLWFWTDEEGEIIDDDNPITHWMRLPPAPPQTHRAMSAQTDRILPTLQELRDNGESDPKASLIFQALGAASVCWGLIKDAGVFDSDRAKQIGNELLSELEAPPSEPRLTVDQLRDEMELLGSMIRAERSTATEANRQCTDEQLERCYQLRDRLKAAQ